MMNSIQNSPSAVAQVSTRPVQSDFTLACASGSAKGTGVIPITTESGFDLPAILKDHVATNGGKPLEQIVATHWGSNISNLPDAVNWLKKEGFLAENGTLSLLGGDYKPEALQSVVDKNPGMTIVYQADATEKGVSIYTQGQKPQSDPAGEISDGGFGRRGCGTKPGYTAPENESTKISSRLI